MFIVGQPETVEEYEEYYDLRWRLLREPWGQPRGSEKDEFESRASHVTIHSEEGELLGIGRLHLHNENVAQIRYMAVEKEFRQKGIGRIIVEKLEEIASDQGVRKIVLNAREDIVGFYGYLGYFVLGEGPVMFDQIKHTKMEKEL